MQRTLRLVFGVALLAVSISTSARAQSFVYSRVEAAPAGQFPTLRLVEVVNGVGTDVPTGLVSDLFPSLSHDGRFVLIASADPAAPNEASGDLFEFDRVTRQRRKIVDNDTETRPDGSIFFSSPRFSARSPDNQLIALSTQLGAVPNGGISLPRQLTVHRASDGLEISLAEIGNGSAIDFFGSEFLGISWSPDGSVFATSAYVNVTSNRGRPTAAAGIVLYGRDPLGSFVRVGQVAVPRVRDEATTIVIETLAFPAFSPDGRRVAFFSITYPDPLLIGPATTQLHVADTSGANRRVVHDFGVAAYPGGLSWTSDGRQIIVSIANQLQSGGQFLPAVNAATAVLRLIDAAGGPLQTVRGAGSGLFPSAVLAPPAPGTSRFVRGEVNGDGRIDLSDGISILRWLFLGAETPGCLDALDTDDSGDIDLSDGVRVFVFLFLGGPSPAAPGPSSCGTDPSPDALDCRRFDRCA